MRPDKTFAVSLISPNATIYAGTTTVTAAPSTAVTVTATPTIAPMAQCGMGQFRFHALSNDGPQVPLDGYMANAAVELIGLVSDNGSWEYVDTYANPGALLLQLAVTNSTAGDPEALNLLVSAYNKDASKPLGWVQIAISDTAGHPIEDVDQIRKFSTAPLHQIIEDCGGTESADVSGRIDMPDGRRYEMYGEGWTANDQQRFLPPPPPRPPAPARRDRLSYHIPINHCYDSGQRAHRNYLLDSVDWFCWKYRGRTLVSGARIKQQRRYGHGLGRMYVQTELIVDDGDDWTIDWKLCLETFHKPIDECDTSSVVFKQGGKVYLGNVVFRVDPQKYGE